MRITALMTGCVAALLAVVAQAYYTLGPPAAYGICVVCHGRDLVHWLLNNLLHFQLPLSLVAKKVPLLTVVGILMGAGFASWQNSEFKPQWIEDKVTAFFTGMIVMISGLAISACPMRLLLRTAYGDFLALLGVIFLIIGISAGTFYLKGRAQKDGNGDS